MGIEFRYDSRLSQTGSRIVFMSNLTHNAIVFALGVCSIGLHSAAYSQRNAIKKAPTGSVSGRITVKGKDRAGIVVALRTTEFRPQPGPVFKASTDPDGNYRIANVPAGSYQVTPIAPAYVGLDQDSFYARSKTVILAEGEIVENIDFSIVRGAVITGKVTHADGRPVVEEPVTAIPAEETNQRPMTYPGSTFQTDDRGIYRVFGLAAGRYKVAVGQPEEAFFATINGGRPAYEQVFYPNVTKADEAKVIELVEGGEATNIDITVGQSIPGFAASGLVLDGERNQPLANVRFGLQRSEGEHNSSMIGTVAASNSRGEFRLENLTPGEYAVFILPQQNSALRGDALPFEIVDQDVTGLILRSAKGASVSGTVVLEETSDKVALARLAQLRIQAFVRVEGISDGFAQFSPINMDGSFRLGGLQAGIANFQLGTLDRTPLKGFIISRIERDGVVQLRGLEIKSGEQISGVRIVVSYGSGIVRGTVKIVSGTPPADVRLIVRLTKPGNNSFGLRPQEVDSRGHFVIEGVPAGYYDLNVNAYFPGSRAQAPSAKQSITVNDGTATEVLLVIDLTANPDQSSNP